MGTRLEENSIYLQIFSITIILSGVIFIEPAPYDFLILLLLFIAVYKNYLTYSKEHFWPIIFLLIFIETNFISLYFIKDMYSAIFFMLITIYCIVMWATLVGINSYFGKKILSRIFNMYILSSLIVVIPGLITYYYPLPFSDLLIYGDSRIKSFFKDPNVFGPFLIPPTLYTLWLIEKNSKIKMFVAILLFLLFTSGILLSYSRAAWGQFILSIIIYFIARKDKSIKTVKTIFSLIIIGIPIMIYIIFFTQAGKLFFERTSLQTYDQVRFSQQERSLDYFYHFPLGFGPGQSEMILSQSTHSLFIRIFSEYGIIGLICFVIFLTITLKRSFFLSKNDLGEYKIFYTIITASIIGVIFNSFFVDTLHWRHFWLLLSLPWIPSNKINKEKINGGKNY